MTVGPIFHRRKHDHSLAPDLTELNPSLLKIGDTLVITAARKLQNIAAIIQSVLPDATNTYDLGSAAKAWKDGYIAGILDAGSLKIGGTEVFDASRNLKNITEILDVGDINITGVKGIRWSDIDLYRRGAYALAIYPTAANAWAALQLIPTRTTGMWRAGWEMFNTDYIADSTNYERFIIWAHGTHYNLASEKGGTGTARPIYVTVGGNRLLSFEADATLDFQNRVLDNIHTLKADNYEVNGSVGADGSFTTVDGKTVTVTKGLITSIV